MDNALEIVSTGKLLHVRVSGKLTKESYEAFTPLVEKLIEEHGKSACCSRHTTSTAGPWAQCGKI